jgi:hypothetical protein
VTVRYFQGEKMSKEKKKPKKVPTELTVRATAALSKQVEEELAKEEQHKSIAQLLIANEQN